ncbi:hypothetical protein TNCV_1725601 [Trichonephila clavipes]|nr:hypothetical protein TNCV_1725601 [Trichonephila clavipes]
MWQRAKLRMSLAVALRTIQVRVRFVSVHPNLEEEHSGGSEGSHLSSPPTNHARGLVARLLFRVPPCR